MNHAVVDLGSNTIRLSLYNILPGGGFRLLFSEKETAGIAGYISDGILSQEGVERAASALLQFQTLLEHLGEQQIHVFATASLRNIRNTAQAVEELKLRTGILVDVLSGEEEARLGYQGALLTCKTTPEAMFDIGGGSTEILEAPEGAVQNAKSYPIGSLNLFTRYVSKIWPKERELEDIRRYVRQELEGALPQEAVKHVCGIGGTARAVLKIANAWYRRSPETRTLTPDQLEEITQILCRRDKTARQLILRNCPDRVHTVLPGALLMNTLGQALCREEIFISKYGVREGYLCHKLLKATT